MTDGVITKELLAELDKKFNAFKNAEVKIAIIGQSGSGKSSLINAIAGQRIAKVGATETTVEAQSFSSGGITFTDLPGLGTIKFPKDEYIAKFELEAYDAVIVVTANRFYENDLWLIKEMNSLGKFIFVVRTKIDTAVESESYDNGLSESQALEKIRSDISANLSEIDIGKNHKGIYLTSSRFSSKYDFSRLMNTIANSLSNIKKDRFVADAAITSESMLNEKRKVAEKIVSWRAVASAANGLNPIPGLDVAVDISILIEMGKQIQKIYGLDEEQIAYAESLSRGKVSFSAIKKNVAQFVGKFLVKEGIIILLKKMGLAVAAKSLVKWIPFIGSIVSAGIGYKTTLYFGEEMIDEAESVCREVLQSISEDVADLSANMA